MCRRRSAESNKLSSFTGNESRKGEDEEEMKAENICSLEIAVSEKNFVELCID